MYVREYFEESARQSANDMVKDIRSVFNEIIDELDWMDDQTRIRAKGKAAAMTTHIAYPDELLDDKKLTDLYENVTQHILPTIITLKVVNNICLFFLILQLTLNTQDYLRNALNLTIFGTNYSFKKLRLPVNKTDWVSHGRPAVVNAYYSPLENSIRKCLVVVAYK